MGRAGGESSHYRLGANDLNLLIVVLVWGFNLPAVKLALREMAPLAFNGVRFTAAACILLAVTKLRGGSLRVPGRDALWMILLGVLGHTIYQLFFIEGLAHTTASHTALIFGTTPVMMAIVSAVLGYEKIRLRGWAGAALAFCGIYIIISGKPPSSGHEATILGDVLIFLCTVCWCFYTVLARPLLERHSPLKVTAISMGCGALLLLPVTVPWVGDQDWSAVSTLGWSLITYSCLLPLVVAYVLWYRSVRAVGSVRTAIYSNLVPVVGTLAAWLVLHERLYPSLGLGAAAIFTGIVLTRSRSAVVESDVRSFEPEPAGGE